MTTEGGGHDCVKVLESEPPLPVQGLDGRDRDRDRDLIVEELMSLRNRIEELELENARLASHMANCPCQKMLDSDLGLGSCGDTRGNNMSQQDDSGSSNSLYDGKPIRCAEKKFRHKRSGCYQGVLHHHAKRFIALKIMYFGQRFYGFASEAQMDPTIESEIFKALAKTKLLVGDKEKSCYSRCGRTDKGVSSIGQVILLFVRSNLKDTRGHENPVETGPEYICEEIDYVKVLNRVLPKDIRVIGWCPAPPNFHARFSCLSRQYKYLFWREDLDISAMDLASKKFIGEHDFRNFCKMDAANVHNYKRQITSFEISSCNQRSDCKEVWAMTIRGSAFLWHQVRCMVAVLFMIGQGLESPTVIDELLDINRTPRKPQYVMASELPLILESCDFNGLHFVCSSDAGRALHDHLKNEFQTFMLQATFFQEALSSVSIPGRSPLEHCKKKSTHIPLMSRPTEPSYEERRAKLSMRANCKNLPADKPLKDQRIDYAEFDHAMLQSSNLDEGDHLKFKEERPLYVEVGELVKALTECKG